MAQDINKLIKALREGIVLVQYESLKSGETKTREMTLNEDYTKGVSIHLKSQDPNSDKILMYDIEFMKWDDIDVHTILNWKKY